MAIHKTKKSTSILNKNFLTDHKGEEGKDYINIGLGGQKDPNRSKLGKLLAPDNITYLFSTPLGKVNSLRTWGNILVIPDYPKRLYTKIPSAKDKGIQFKEKRKLPNFFSLLALGTALRIKQNPELFNLIKENTLPITALNLPVAKDVFGSKVLVSGLDIKLNRYVGILQIISDLIKQGNFNDIYIKKFIDDCKDEADEDIWSGVEGITVVEGDNNGVEGKKESYEDASGSFA